MSERIAFVYSAFFAYEDKVVFETLLTLSGVGAKGCTCHTFNLNLSAINRAIVYNDPQIFTSVPGVGPRLAEKVLVELKPKLDKMRTRAQGLGLSETASRLSDADFDDMGEEQPDSFKLVLDDVRSALENLGFKDKSIVPP